MVILDDDRLDLLNFSTVSLASSNDLPVLDRMVLSAPIA